MDQEIKKLEQLKQQEVVLMQQIYEKQISYLNTKITLLTNESKNKDQQLENLKTDHSQHMSTISEVDSEQDDFETKKQLIIQKHDEELQIIRSQYQKELQQSHQQLKIKDLMIEQIRKEISQYQKLSTQDLDNSKIITLSQIIEVTNELILSL